MAKNNSLSVNLTVPVGLAAIDKNIKWLGTNLVKINEMIHVTALGVMLHAMEHGDCTRAQTLINAMPASHRRLSLKDWFAMFSPIVVKIDDPKWTGKMHKEGTKLYVPFDVPAAKATPFYDLAKQTPEGKTFDLSTLLKMIEGAVKRANKNLDDGEVPAEDRSNVIEIVTKLSAIKVEPKVATPAPGKAAA